MPTPPPSPDRSPEGPARGVAEAETWDLAALFPSREAFERCRTSVRESLPGLEARRGSLDRSGAVLAEALDAIDGVVREINRLYAYASMRSDEDTRVAANQALRQEIELLWNDLARRTSWLRPEILTIAPDRMERFLADEPALAPHAHFLRNLMRQRAHVLTPPEERILAEAGLVTGGASSLYGVLHNAELPRPAVRLSSGETVELTPAAFSRHRTTAVREDRAVLFREYFGAYARFRETFGTNLHEAVKSHVFRARARGYAGCLEAALDADHVPTAVYRNLVTQIRAELPKMHRYFALRARALGVDRVEYHDLHCPIAPGPGRAYAPVEADELVRRAMEPLGPAYAETLRRCRSERWIDWHPTPGKRSGAYASGAAYDVHPYVLLNFNGDYESVSTLAHELGHAAHSDFSNRAQPYATADYSIFVAEVASTFNEALLNARMLDEAEDDRERLFLLGTYLDQLRATLFRQTMFAEFELAIHERAAAGEALTGESLSALYLGILRDYHGHDAGVLEVPERYAVEWAAVPHFYYDFYVYQYATGIVASTALAEAALAGEPGARDRYVAFLSSGGSDYPLELLRRAGVDLEAAEPYARTFHAMERALDRLEDLLGRLGR